MRGEGAPHPAKLAAQLQCAALVFGRSLSDFLTGASLVPERTPLLWVRVFHQAIHLPPFVIFGEIFGNW